MGVQTISTAKSAPTAATQGTSSRSVGQNTRNYAQCDRQHGRATASVNIFRPELACNLLPPRLAAWTGKTAHLRGVLGALRAGPLLREIPRLVFGEDVRAGPLWMGDPLEVVPLGDSNHPQVMPAGTLERTGEPRPTVRALVSDPAESLGWSPTSRSQLWSWTMETRWVFSPWRSKI